MLFNRLPRPTSVGRISQVADPRPMSEHLAPALQLMKTRVASRKIATHSCIRMPTSLGWQDRTRDPNGPRFAGTESESADSDRLGSIRVIHSRARAFPLARGRRAFPPGAVADSETDEPDGRQRHRPPASGSRIPLRRIHHRQRPRLETNRPGRKGTTGGLDLGPCSLSSLNRCFGSSTANHTKEPSS